VKLAIALASGATSVVLQLWMPSLTSWLNDVEIHRKGFSQVMYDELTNVGEAERVGAKRHLAQKVSPKVIGVAGQDPQEAARLLSGESFGDSAAGLNSTLDALVVSFCGPHRILLKASGEFQEICGECLNLEGFRSMLLEGRAFSGQVNAALTSGAASLSEVTLFPPSLPSIECKADCAVKAYRKTQSGKETDVICVCLFALRWWPRRLRGSPGSRTESAARTSSQGEGTRRGSSHEIRHLELRQGLARSNILAKIPELERRLLESANEWRASELQGSRGILDVEIKKVFLDATDRLDVARACVGLAPVRAFFSFVDDGVCTKLTVAESAGSPCTGSGAPAAGLDLLANRASGLKALLTSARALANGDRAGSVQGTVFAAHQPGAIFATLHCREVLKRYEIGDCVTARGPPQDTNGIVMLPIDPAGAVQIGNFVVKSFTPDEIARKQDRSPESEHGSDRDELAVVRPNATDTEAEERNFRLKLMMQSPGTT